MQRVTILSNTLDAGGAEVQRVTLANHLAARGFPTRLVVLQRSGVLRSRLRPDVPVAVETFRLPLAHPADVLVTGTTNTELVKGLLSRIRRPGLRWIVAVHNPVGPEAPVPSWFRRSCMLLADRLLALSPAHAAGLARRWRIRPDALVSNGADLEWAEDVRASRAATSAFDHDLLHLGRLDVRHKGIDLLLDAMQRGPATWTLGIAGTGPDEAAIRARVDRAGLAARVALLGHLEPRDALARGAVIVLLSRYEGQPMVLIEAAAAGVPVVASEHAGASPGAGARIVDAGDPAAVVRAIDAALAEDPPVPVLHDAAEMVDGYVAEFAAARRGGRLLRLHLGRVVAGPVGRGSATRSRR